MAGENSKEIITLAELERLTCECVGVLNSVDAFGLENTCKDDIIGSLRKLLVATALYKRQIICIAGPQGAGKTSLMRNFYGLKNVLNGTRGVGERVPVIITEKKDITTPELYCVELGKDKDQTSTIIKTLVGLEEYDTLTNAQKPNVMYFEVLVPFKYFRDSSENPPAFMLLPGFESNKEDSYYWNNLIEFSLNCSDAAVFVITESQLSSLGGDQYLDQVKEKFGKRLVYVFTNSEIPSSKLSEIISTLIEEKNVDRDQIVCSGFFPEDKQRDQAWKDAFVKAVNAYAKVDSVLIRNSEYIFSELEILQKTLRSLKAEVGRNKFIRNASSDTDSWLKAFDERKKEMRDILEKQLKQQYGIAEKTSKKRLVQIVEQESKDQGIKKIGKDLLQLVLTKTHHEAYEEPEKQIVSALSDDDGYIPDNHLRIAIQNAMKQIESLSGQSSFGNFIETKQEDNKTMFIEGETTVAFQEDIANLLIVRRGNEQLLPLKSHDQIDVMCALVEFATYYFLFALNENMTGNHNISDISIKAEEVKLDVDHVLKGADSVKKFAVGIAGMMGVDVIADGAINFIPQIAESIGASVPVVGAITCAALLLGGAVVVARDINKMNCNDILAKQQAITKVYGEFQQTALGAFDDYMKKIKGRVSNTLRKLDGSGAQAVAAFNAQAQINNALDYITAIKGRCNGCATGLEFFLQ